MVLYLATWTQEINQKLTLNAMKKSERLLSFYLISTDNKKFEEYFDEGKKTGND